MPGPPAGRSPGSGVDSPGVRRTFLGTITGGRQLSAGPLGRAAGSNTISIHPGHEEPLWRAALTPGATRYLFVSRALALFASIIGIPLLPFWVLGFGQWYVREWVQRFSCTLTPERLRVQQGVFVRSQSDIPLDRITDLRLYHGPLMRLLGVLRLNVKNAGQGAAQSEGNLIGIVDSPGFRDAVLRRRDLVAARAEVAPFHEQVLDLLNQILATLKDHGSPSSR